MNARRMPDRRSRQGTRWNRWVATKDTTQSVDGVIDQLIDSQHPQWLEVIAAARLDEAAEVDPTPEQAVRPYRWLIETVGDGVARPHVLDGARACPPEGRGGVWGYANLIAASADPNHPEPEDLLAWVGDGFDPEAFDLVEVDARVVAYGRAQELRRWRRGNG